MAISGRISCRMTVLIIITGNSVFKTGGKYATKQEKFKFKKFAEQFAESQQKQLVQKAQQFFTQQLIQKNRQLPVVPEDTA